MRVFNLQVFDAIIAGTAGTWYSRSEFDHVLGLAGNHAFQACVSDVRGTSPTLSVASETSADSLNWISSGGPSDISGVSMSNNSSYAGANTLGSNGPFVRLRITLGGTSPSCRLVLYVTGHDSAA